MKRVKVLNHWVEVHPEGQVRRIQMWLVQWESASGGW